MPYGNNILNTASDTAMEKYVHIHHQNMHWKCVFRCCVQYPRIDIPSPE